MKKLIIEYLSGIMLPFKEEDSAKPKKFHFSILIFPKLQYFILLKCAAIIKCSFGFLHVLKLLLASNCWMLFWP